MLDYISLPLWDGNAAVYVDVFGFSGSVPSQPPLGHKFKRDLRCDARCFAAEPHAADGSASSDIRQARGTGQGCLPCFTQSV